MPKIQQSKDRFFITIPIDVIRNKKWTKGTNLILMFNERGNVEIREADK